MRHRVNARPSAVGTMAVPLRSIAATGTTPDRSMTREQGDLPSAAGEEDRHDRRDQDHARHAARTTSSSWRPGRRRYGVLAEGAIAVQGDHALVVARFANTESARAIYDDLLWPRSTARSTSTASWS